MRRDHHQKYLAVLFPGIKAQSVLKCRKCCEGLLFLQQVMNKVMATKTTCDTTPKLVSSADYVPDGLGFTGAG